MYNDSKRETAREYKFKSNGSIKLVVDVDPLGLSKEDRVFYRESKLNKPILDAFKKAHSEINIFELPKEKKEKFDNFLVANTFEKKDINRYIKPPPMEQIAGELLGPPGQGGPPLPPPPPGAQPPAAALTEQVAGGGLTVGL